MTDHCCGRGVNLPHAQSAEIEPAPSTAEGLEAKVAELQEAKVHSHLAFCLLPSRVSVCFAWFSPFVSQMTAELT